MLKPAFALLLAVTLLFGGASTLAYAAQDDLPGEALYALKLVGEDVRLGLAFSDAAQMEQVLNMAQNRVNEAVALAKNGEEAPEPLVNRLNNHLNYALRLASGMNDENLQQAMLQIRSRIEAQIRELNRINQTGNGSMLQIQQRLQEKLRMAELGLEDPLKFRQQTQLQTKHQTEETGSSSNTPQSSATPQGPKANAEQPGPQGPQGTPDPQGPQGPQSTSAPQDTPVPEGPQGPNGTPEPQGPHGPLNTDGPEDPHGPQGPNSTQPSDQGHNGKGKPTPTPTGSAEPVGESNSPGNSNNHANNGRN